MPLLDHFHPPLLNRPPSWESFHSFWAVAIAEHLNQLLPRRYIATVTTHLGSEVEADVAEFESPFEPEDGLRNGPGGGVAVQTWTPPATTLVAPAVFPDDFEVHVHDQLDGAQLVAAIELASPRNKDRPESRRAFAAKCAAYLQRGIGLIAVDIVTNRHAILHNELAQLMGWDSSLQMPADTFLYAVAYRPARRKERNEIDIWPAALAVDASLPLLPLALKRARAVPLDLETTYTHARQRSRL